MPMRSVVGMAIAVACVAVMAAQERSEPQRPTFTSETTVVEVSAIITKDGETVTDIRQDEVVVRDNGAPQELVVFEYVDLLSPADAEASAPSAVSATPAMSRRRDYVLVLDDLHISPRLTKPTMDLAHTLLDMLAPEDRLAIVNTGPHELLQQLSTDREEARRLIARFRGQKPKAVPRSTELEVRTLMVLRALQNVADAVAFDASERRTVVIVSEGQPLGPSGPKASPLDFRNAWDTYEQVVAAASVANVAIYAIDPRGLEAVAPVINVDGNHMAAAIAGGTIQAATSEMLIRYYGTLGFLSASTGGTLTVDTNNLAKGLPKMIRDSKQYYRLAYQQPEVAADERTRPRRISVSVTRPDVVVRARTTYLPYLPGE